MASAPDGGEGVRAVLLLDFDGVICDSSGESSVSAWNASARFWPEAYRNRDAQRDAVVASTSAVRPVVETGYENMLQSRALLEGRASEADILGGWDALRPALLAEWDVSRDALVSAFADERDAWIARDEASWIGHNRIYPGVGEALASALARPELRVLIVTTKQTRYVVRILAQMANIAFPEDRVFSSTVSGKPKAETIADLMASEALAGVDTWHFVEDRYPTLAGIVARDPGFFPKELGMSLVDWGFNVEAEREEARGCDRIQVIALDAFHAMLKDGLAQ